MTSTNLTLPYKIGFATLTASALLSVGMNGDACLHPFDVTSIEPIAKYYSWEKPSSSSKADFYEHNLETLQQIEMLQNFAVNMLLNSKDIPAEIYDIVSDNFEDLLA